MRVVTIGWLKNWNGVAYVEYSGHLINGKSSS